MTFQICIRIVANDFYCLTHQRIGDASLREQLLSDDRLSEELIDGMVVKFLEQVKQDTWSSIEWPQMYTDYSVSKLAVNAYTRFVARRLLDRPEGQKIYINCFCPGWVKTAMTGWEGNISAEEGADTAVWLALLPHEQSTIGKFFAERREMNF
jgi:NAD(P)-dependent dehydrogenase (short-subunit alcohol dehydrogenase family)